MVGAMCSRFEFVAVSEERGDNYSTHSPAPPVHAPGGQSGLQQTVQQHGKRKASPVNGCVCT